MTNKEYYQLNKGKWKGYYEKAKQDPTFLDRKNDSAKSYYARLKEAVYAKLGSVCVRCGFKDRRALQIDHVNGCGYEERKQCKSAAFLKKVLADKEGNYQILCANCNWIKKAESPLESPSPFTPLVRESLV